MSEVTLVINGRDVTAEEGMTILEAARAAGVDVPTLCNHEELAPFGACRLCTVEIAKGGRSRLVASCVYPVEEGLDVQTESEPVVKGRKLILEMLLARAPGVQVLRDYGKRYGVDATKFSVGPELLHSLRSVRQLLRGSEGEARHRLHRQRSGAAGHVPAGSSRRQVLRVR